MLVALKPMLCLGLRANNACNLRVAILGAKGSQLRPDFTYISES